MNPQRHKEFLRCRDFILAALHYEMTRRNESPDLSWIDKERMMVVDAANIWAATHAPLTTVSSEAVERVEDFACGHVDYASKLALYVAEMVYGVRDLRP